MYILKSISNAFSRFWRWIRETAWVQPLLIVGGIFSVIFSIPKFTTWFKAMGADSTKGYLNSFKVSLEGEGRIDVLNGVETPYDSQADKLTRTLHDFSYQFVNKEDFASYEAFRGELEKSGALQYGEKYYLAYVSRDSAGSETAQVAFETLQNNWGSTFTPATEGEEFKLHTIFTDDTSTNDDDYEIEENKKAFNRYLSKWSGGNGGADFFSFVGTSLEETAYKTNASISDGNYTNIAMPDAGTWAVPTIFLVDFTKSAFETGRFGLTEALFSVTGDNDYDKASLLMNMWNHNNGRSDNPFSDKYIAK